MDRKKLRQMGLMFMLSYGFVANVSAMLLTCLSAYVAMARTGASPFGDASALRQFGVTYGGLYVVSNLMRPLKLGTAIAIAPAFQALVGYIEQRLNCKRSIAVALTALLTHLGFCLAALLGGLSVASWVTGVSVNLSQMGALFRVGRAARSSM